MVVTEYLRKAGVKILYHSVFGHVSQRNRHILNQPAKTCLTFNFGFFLMLFGIEHFVKMSRQHPHLIPPLAVLALKFPPVFGVIGHL